MLLSLLITLPFAALLIKIGLAMVRVTSWAKLIDDYEKNPKNADWVVKYFFGFFMKFQRNMQRQAISMMGDKFITLYYRAAGAFFILLAAATVITTIILSFSNLA